MGFIRSLTGSRQARAAEKSADIQAAAATEAIEAQEAAAGRAQEFFAPFAGAAERGVEAAGFLADPQAQFEFLEQNPLFKLALENANQQTLQQASAGRRLSFGDTLQQLSSNVLLSAQPLIERQRQDVTNLLQFGGDVATSQANIETGQAARIGDLITGRGAVLGAGKVGAAQASATGAQNILNTALTAAGTFSDERLKENKRIIGKTHGLNLWSWDWNKLAGELFGLFGSSEGVMAQEVLKVNPDAIILDDSGYFKVNYGAL